MAAPQTVNRLTAFMAELFSDMDKIKVSTGFMSLWGKSENGSITERVDDSLEFTMDIIRGKKKISDINPRSLISGETNIGSNLKTRTGEVFQNVSRLFPLIIERAGVEYSDTFKRLAGQLAVTKISGSEMTAFEKASFKLAMGVKENMKNIAGRMELVASEAARTGIITLSDGSTYNFDRSSSNTIVPAILWSVVATAVPIANLEALYDEVKRNGKSTPSACIMGADAFSAFIKTDEITSSADNRDITFVRAGDTIMQGLPGLPPSMSDFEANGFIYQAFVRTPKGRRIFIFVYDEEFQNAADTWVEFMPLNDVLLLDPTARLDRFFGPRIRFDIDTPDKMMIERVFGVQNMIANMPETPGTGVLESWMFHHDTFINTNMTSVGIETYTGPIYAPTQVDAMGLLDGVVA